jgi:hypothetical protein
MTILVHATPAPVPKTKNVRQVAIFYAVVLLIMAVAQLFTFNEFLKLMMSFEFPEGVQATRFITAFIIVAELFAIPFLLRFSLSPAFRWLSMIMGWLVSIIWFKITLWQVLQNTPIDNVGYLGTAAIITPGSWAILISVAFGILAAWASWGMWPGLSDFKRVKKHKK